MFSQMRFNHGWTRMDTDEFGDYFAVFIRVHPCSSVVKTLLPVVVVCEAAEVNHD